MALEFQVKLADGVSTPAGSAAHQVQVLTQQMKSLQTQMIKSNALGNDKAFQKAAGDYQKLGAQVDKLGGSGMPKLGDATKGAGKATGMAGMELNAYVELAKKAYQAIEMVVIAVVGMMKAVYGFAQARKQIEATFGALGQGKTSGKDAVAMLDKLGAVLPFTRSEMSEWAKTMMNAGITDIPRLTQAVKAAAASSAILGDTSGASGKRIADMLVKFKDAAYLRQGIGDLRMELRGTGITSEEVAAKLGMTEKGLQRMAASGRNLSKIGDAIQDALIRKGADPMRTMGASWDTLSKKFHENIASIFEGIADTPGFKEFMTEMMRLVGLFGSQSTGAKGMKSETTGAFNVAFKAASAFAREVRYGALDAEIAWLKFRIAIKPLTNLLGDITTATAKFLGYKSKIDAFSSALGVLKTALLGVAVVVGLLAAAVVISVGMFLGPIMAISFGLYWLIGVIVKFTVVVAKALVGWFKKAWNAGKEFVNGLWEGIKKGWKAMLEKIKSLAKMLPDVVKKALGISSPSRVMMEVGMHTSAGMAKGIEQGHKDVAAAAGGMAKVAVSGASSGRGGKPVSVHLASGAIQINGAGSPQETLVLVEEAAVSLFERIALTQGATA